MSFVMGIDTGGTYTDAVIIETRSAEVLCKAKAPTTYEDLSVGIRASIQALGFPDFSRLSRIVLSTTLATNAVVENKLSPVGLILIGRSISQPLPCTAQRRIGGFVDLRGRVGADIDCEELYSAALELFPFAKALVVSCIMSARNPELEKKAKAFLEQKFSLPVVCSHEVECKLGFYPRTVTAILNAGLFETISNFLRSMKYALARENISAPLYIVRGDGALLSLDCVMEKPVETLLSGPAASMSGAVYLSGLESAAVADMGGTTMDLGLLRNRRVPVSKDGAKVGGWQTQVRSCELSTFGLGGDSEIWSEAGQLRIGPRKVTPACRGGRLSDFTPTDLLHCLGEFTRWDQRRAKEALFLKAREAGLPAQAFLAAAEDCVLMQIYENCLSAALEGRLPVAAVGAPARAWFCKARSKYGFPLFVPKHFEVAAAVGAAAAQVCEELNAIVRYDAQLCMYTAYTGKSCETYKTKAAATDAALSALKHQAAEIAQRQHLSAFTVDEEIADKYFRGNGDTYIETRVNVILKESL